MSNYKLTVYRPVAPKIALNDGDLLANIFTIDVDKPIAWVRENVEALVMTALRSVAGIKQWNPVEEESPYVALMIEPA